VPTARRVPPASRIEPPGPPSDRFRRTDRYRAEREWKRYEGTGQRDLYRELRERFLRRHAVDHGWVLDVGSGPGRFLPFVGTNECRRVALDISPEMIRLVSPAWLASGSADPMPERVLGDACRPPFPLRSCAEVVVLGNTIGFAGRDADELLREAVGLVGDGGVFVAEVAPAPGERSQYFSRLPASSVARLLRSPVRAVLPRLDREGFRAEPARHATGDSFRRLSALDVRERLDAAGFIVADTVAVAPALGPDPERIQAVRSDPKAWSHLLELEEQVGRRPERWPHAAAVLVAARRPASDRMVK